MTDLAAGRRVKALDFTPTKDVYAQVTQLNLTNTNYETGNPTVSVQFYAPTSGRVAVNISAGIQNNAANNDRCFVTFRIQRVDPTGFTLVHTQDSRTGISNWATQNTEYQYSGHMVMVGGLLPGYSHYAQVLHRSTLGAGTIDVAFRAISVFPIS